MLKFINDPLIIGLLIGFALGCWWMLLWQWYFERIRQKRRVEWASLSNVAAICELDGCKEPEYCNGGDCVLLKQNQQRRKS